MIKPQEVMSAHGHQTIAGLVPSWISPNALSLMRLGAGLVVVWLAGGSPRPGWVLAAMGVGLVTDYLDGAVARARGQQSQLGAYLDPVADKVLVVGCVWALWRWGMVKAAMVGAMVAVEAHALLLPPIHVLLRLATRRPLWPLPRVRPRAWGKYKTGFVGGGLVGIMVGAGWGLGWLEQLGRLAVWGGIGAGAVASALYMRDWWKVYLKDSEQEGR